MAAYSMFLARPGPRYGPLRRIAGALVLALLVVLLGVSVVALSYVDYYARDPVTSPHQLYHNTWRAVLDNSYDRARLRDWHEWEHKFDHLIVSEEDALKYADIMVQSLQDPYTALLRAETVQEDKKRADGQFVGIGVELDFATNESHPRIARVMRGGPAQKAGLKVDDEIIEFDGSAEQTESMEASLAALSGNAGDEVALTIRRDGAVMVIKLKRGPVQTPLVDIERFTLEDGSIVGYVRIDSFGQWTTASQLEAALRELADCQSLIVDVRDNPGGFIHEAVKASSLFIESGVVGTKVSRVPGAGFLTTRIRLKPGSLYLDNKLERTPFVPVPLFARPPYLAAGRPVLVLTNGNTASAAEMFTAALAENGVATTVGAKTFGKGIGQIYIPVGNGHRLKVTHLKSFTPNGNWLGDCGRTVSDGVPPGITAPDTGSAWRLTERDAALQAALARIRQVLAGP